MAVLDVSVRDASGAPDGGAWGYRMLEAEDASKGDRALAVCWSTESGTEAIGRFDVSVSWRGWRKGLPGPSSWSPVRTCQVPAASLASERIGARRWWSCPIARLGLLDALTGQSAWRYGCRTHDRLELQASVRAVFTPSFAADYGHDASNLASATLWVDCVPSYRLARAYYEAGGTFCIEYETTWTRSDDRFCIAAESSCQGRPLLAGALPYGPVAGQGRVRVPASALAFPVAGRRALLAVAFNASWRAPGAGQSLARAELAVGDRRVANTPTLRLSTGPDPYSTYVRTGDSRDRGAPIRTVTVGVAGTAMASTCPVGGVVALRGPLNQAFDVYAVGHGAESDSRTASLSAPPIRAPRVAIVESVEEGGPRVALRHDVSCSVKAEAASDVVKLAGRLRPSSFYGTGGATSVSVKATVLDDDMRALELLPLHGDALVRLPDGRMYRIVPEVSVEWSHERVRRVGIEGSEVGG